MRHDLIFIVIIVHVCNLSDDKNILLLRELIPWTRVSDPKEARMVESFKGEGFQFHSEGHHVIRRVESPLNFGQSNNNSIKRRSR